MKKYFLLISLLSVLYACSASPTPTITPVTSSPTVTPTSLFNFVPVTPTATNIPKIFTATPTLSIPTPSGPIYYTVQPGDTLAGIASKFGIDIAGLARANHIKDKDLIYTDQRLLIDTAPIVAPKADITVGKEIIVVLSDQRAYAFLDGVLLREFKVGTGKAETPTVSDGPYQIESKFEIADMSGPGYHIKDVPWVMYFYQGYGFHAAPWNPNLLQTSHGCVNMKEEDADWLFHWAPLGTSVQIYP